MTTPLDAFWSALLAFVFWYPLFMSYLWMLGAAIFYWRYERPEPSWDHPPELPRSPPVSVLVPLYNEEENAEETLTHALALDYPDFEVIAVNDGSKDGTAEVIDRLAALHPRLKAVHLAQNQGKAMGLQAASLIARHDILLCIDGDALIDRHAARWMVRHFVEDPHVAAVTGNPRIRNRTTLIGRVQVGEFSSIVGIIKRAQRIFGRIFTVSGVIGAFRKSAVHEVGYWSPDVMTEDIDVTWKLHRAGWEVRFEPRALIWILMPETLRGLWKQRLRWAMGGAQVLMKNIHLLFHPRRSYLWPLLVEMCASLLWAYAMLILTVAWLVAPFLASGASPVSSSPLSPTGGGMVLGTTCLLQFVFSWWLDSRYDRGLGRNLYWMIWYPVIYWVIGCVSTVWALPKVLLRGRGARARWVSPDRGFRP